MMQTDQERLFWLLEAERLDVSYRKPKPKQGFTELLPKEQQQAWFQAGRYSEGARDKAAVRGNAFAMKIASQA